MQQIFIEQEPINGRFVIGGGDAHHLIRVVRLRVGERLRVSTSVGDNYICTVESIDDKELSVTIESEVQSTELANRIYLFQAIPKGDRMENIIEKCVELGVYEIIPVEMKNCIVRLDDKKRKSKVERYQTIAKSAAEQSKRSIIPRIHSIMKYRDAIDYARQCKHVILPYESKNGMQDTFNVLKNINKGEDIAVIIGPEGGFDKSEIDMVVDDAEIISLGGRILRTDTAAICSLSMLMLRCEEIQ